MDGEMIENYAWESDEANYWEADEAFDEAEDSAEDYGERERWRRRSGRSSRPVPGVRGMAVRRQDGGIQNLPFPQPLAPVQQTNQKFALQEVARRELAERMNRLEASYRAL